MKSHDVHAIKRTQYDMHWKSFVDKRKLKDIYPGYTQLVCLFSLQEKSLSTKKKEFLYYVITNRAYITLTLPQNVTEKGLGFLRQFETINMRSLRRED